MCFAGIFHDSRRSRNKVANGEMIVVCRVLTMIVFSLCKKKGRREKKEAIGEFAHQLVHRVK